MKKISIILLSALMLLCLALPLYAQEAQEALQIPVFSATEYDRMLTEIPQDADLDTAIYLENRNFKNIQSLKPLFDEDTYTAYSKAITKMKKEHSFETVNAALSARTDLVLTDALSDRVLFIWDGTTMPCKDGEELTEEDIDTSQMFGYGFEPFAITYLLEDQSQVKGNVIAVSGGGFLVWSNGAEGYPAAGVFNDLGYNYFLLQRRVGPYCEEDIYMDYNRYVKVVKNYVRENNLGGQDMYAGLGWSGGGSTILGGAVNYLYGSLNPTVYDSDYVPDEIDAISGDLDVEMVIYGAGQGLVVSEDENPNLPAFYISVGSEDGDGPIHSQALYDEAVARGVPAELYIVEGAPHGYGVGLPPANGIVPGSELWPAQADEFMQENLGYQKNRYAVEETGAVNAADSVETEVEEIEETIGDNAESGSGEGASEASQWDGIVPEEYTMVKEFSGSFGFGDADITAYTNDDHSRFYLNWICFDEDQVLEGTIEDGKAIVEFDLTGFLAQDAQVLWDAANAYPAEWETR